LLISEKKESPVEKKESPIGKKVLLIQPEEDSDKEESKENQLVEEVDPVT